MKNSFKHILFGKNNNNKSYTPITHDKTFKNYIRFIKSVKMLSPSEQKEYIIKYKMTKDEKYKEGVIYSNLLMVLSISKQFIKNHEDELMDIIQSGNYGLLVAFNKYEPQYNVSYYTYAVYWVRYYIQKHIESIENNNKIDHKTIKEVIDVTEYVNACFKMNIIPSFADIIINTKVRNKTLNRIKDMIIQSFNIFLYDRNYTIRYESIIEYMKYDMSDVVNDYINNSLEKTKDINYTYFENEDIYANIIKTIRETEVCKDDDFCMECGYNFAKYIIDVPHQKDKVRIFVKIINNNPKLKNALLKLVNEKNNMNNIK